jgi:hypothetical protein
MAVSTAEQRTERIKTVEDTLSRSTMTKEKEHEILILGGTAGPWTREQVRRNQRKVQTKTTRKRYGHT